MRPEHASCCTYIKSCIYIYCIYMCVCVFVCVYGICIVYIMCIYIYVCVCMYTFAYQMILQITSPNTIRPGHPCQWGMQHTFVQWLPGKQWTGTRVGESNSGNSRQGHSSSGKIRWTSRDLPWSLLTFTKSPWEHTKAWQDVAMRLHLGTCRPDGLKHNQNPCSDSNHCYSSKLAQGSQGSPAVPPNQPVLPGMHLC